MSLSYRATAGELRHGRHLVARLIGCTKTEARVTFTVTYVNRFAAGLGMPTEVVLQATPTGVCRYPVVSGSAADGAVKIDPVRVIAETRTL